MPEFYYSDYDNYFDLFIKHSEKIAKMMSQLNYQITELGMSPMPSQDLLRITIDLLYYVDQTYKKENKISDKYDVLDFPTSDELLNSMRSVFKEELDRYLGSNNGSTK